MFVKKPDDCDTKHHRSIVCGIVIMRTRRKVCKYATVLNDQSAKTFVICEDNRGVSFSSEEQASRYLHKTC